MAQPHAPIVQSLRETWFWAEVFRDHSMFIFDGLAPDQGQLIHTAQFFKERLTSLAQEAQAAARSAGIAGPAGAKVLADGPDQALLSGLQGHELVRHEQAAQALNRSLSETLPGLYEFKQELLQRKLDCKVTLNLGPALIAHMINELEESARVLGHMRDGAPLPPSMEALHHHLIWLPDASGHAIALHNGMDGVERDYREMTQRFADIFNGMHIKALELYSMLRVAPRMVGALRRLNKDSVAEIAVFRDFLAELREHLEGCEIMGTLMPLLADHMLREELYYMEKIMSIDS